MRLLTPPIFLPLLPLLTLAQDQCNLLPLRGHIDLPLHHLKTASLDPTPITLCDQYAPKNAPQLSWITQVINGAFIGNYTPVVGPKWPQDPNGTYQGTGLLDPHAVYRDPCGVVTSVPLVGWFNGSRRSTNRGGVSEIS